MAMVYLYSFLLVVASVGLAWSYISDKREERRTKPR